MVKVKRSNARCATEKDIVDIIYLGGIDFDDWVLTVIVFSFPLLLHWSLTLSKRSTCRSCLAAVLTDSEVWNGRILVFLVTDAAPALQDEISFANFGDQVVTRASMAKTSLVVG